MQHFVSVLSREISDGTTDEGTQDIRMSLGIMTHIMGADIYSDVWRAKSDKILIPLSYFAFLLRFSLRFFPSAPSILASSCLSNPNAK